MNKSIFVAVLSVSLCLTSYANASSLSNRVIQEHSGFNTSGYGLMVEGSTKADQSRLAKATSLFERANELLPQSVINTFSYASVLYDEANATPNLQDRTEKLVQAKWMFRRVTNLNPEFVMGYYKLSEVSWDLKQYDEIVTYLKEGLENNPNDILMQYSLGLAYEKLKRADEAMNEYQHVLALNPKFSPAYFSYGDLLEASMKFTEAEVLYKKALTYQPEQNGYRLALANMYINQEKFHNAEAVLLDALSHDDKNYLIYVGLGHVYYTKGDYSHALQMYESAKILEPNDKEVVYYISLSMSHITHQQNNKAALQKASR